MVQISDYYYYYQFRILSFTCLIINKVEISMRKLITMMYRFDATLQFWTPFVVYSWSSSIFCIFLYFNDQLYAVIRSIYIETYMLYPARAIVKELLWPVDKILYVTEVLGKFYPLTKISTAPHAYMSTRLIKIPQLRVNWKMEQFKIIYPNKPHRKPWKIIFHVIFGLLSL